MTKHGKQCYAFKTTQNLSYTTSNVFCQLHEIPFEVVLVGDNSCPIGRSKGLSGAKMSPFFKPSEWCGSHIEKSS